MSMTIAMSTLPGVGSPLRLGPVTNIERMYALDEAWNARDWDTFDAYHDQDDVVVYWPGRESNRWRPSRPFWESRASRSRSGTEPPPGHSPRTRSDLSARVNAAATSESR